MSCPEIIPTDRERLPHRRLSETRRIEHRSEDGRSTRFFVTLGYAAHDPLRPREVFYDDGFRSGADLEFLIQDAAILISLLLQHGVTPNQIGHALSTTEDGAPGSMIAALVQELGTTPQWDPESQDQTS